MEGHARLVKARLQDLTRAAERNGLKAELQPSTPRARRRAGIEPGPLAQHGVTVLRGGSMLHRLLLALAFSAFCSGDVVAIHYALHALTG